MRRPGLPGGSGWSSYQKRDGLRDPHLPAGLRQADRLPEPIFTPTTKAPKGSHDEPIDDAQGEAAVGRRSTKVKAVSLALYRFGHDRARQAGMILADTKFEFGTDPARATLVLIDEVLTPDSSRYWPAESYAPGQSPPSYDKQFVRDHLLGFQVGPEAAGAAAPRRSHSPDPGKIPGGAPEADRVGKATAARSTGASRR
jgi:phosphoribosylaminoimidazole-succinocarboxamide synthase